MTSRARERRAAEAGPRLSSIWVAAALLLPPTISLGARLSTGDLGYGIRAGQIMIQTGDVLRVDLFTITARCDPWLNQQWAGQVLVAGVFDASGWLGMALFRAGLAIAVAALTYAACRAAGADRRAAAWLSLLSWLPHLGGQLRATFFGLLVFAALLWVVAGRERHPGRLPLAVPLLLIWANVHGSFPLGILVLAFAWIEDLVVGRSGRRTLVVAGLATIATVVTPFGPSVWTYVVDLSTDPLIREAIAEWQPPWVSPPVAVVFFASAALALAAFVRYRRDLPWPRWVQLAIFFGLGVSQMRAVFWWAIVLAITLAGLPLARRSSVADPRNRLNAVLVFAFALLPVVASIRWLPYAGAEAPAHLMRFAPVRLTEKLRTILGPGEPIANPQAWGSWFELTLPRHPVYVDARIEVVPDEDQLAAIRLTRAEPGWEEALDAVPARVLVVDRLTQPNLVDAMPTASTWREVYADDDGLVFVREGAPPFPPLPECEDAPG